MWEVAARGSEVKVILGAIMSSDKPVLHEMLFQNQTNQATRQTDRQKHQKPKNSPWQVKEHIGFTKLWVLVIAWEAGLLETCLNGITTPVPGKHQHHRALDLPGSTRPLSEQSTLFHPRL